MLPKLKYLFRVFLGANSRYLRGLKLSSAQCNFPWPISILVGRCFSGNWGAHKAGPLYGFVFFFLITQDSFLITKINIHGFEVFWGISLVAFLNNVVMQRLNPRIQAWIGQQLRVFP